VPKRLARGPAELLREPAEECDAMRDDWPDRLFVYGTLRPDDSAWHLVAPHVVGDPMATTVPGTLYDTGLGFPALLAGFAVVPGWTLRLRSPAVALAELDRYEGPEYRRVRVVDSTGVPCWTYLWTAATEGMSTVPDGWPTPTPPPVAD
jgi:gamma-glutamylcyclotransferase (GGCT)/AIG2-like uncharacterized protein YtfP